MEVHHHAHTERKKWTHYLWEFLMLFLAVFCGFLAEYQLEHKFERDRAKELARSFYDELKADSAIFHSVMKNRGRKNEALVYLKKYFLDSNLVNCSREFPINFCYGFATYSPSVFEPKEAILEQLKNSGSLRYFKSEALQQLTGQLAVAITSLHQRNSIELDYSMNQMLPFLIEHNDQKWFDNLGVDSNAFLLDIVEKYEKSGQEISFKFNKAETLDRSAAANLIGVYQILFKGSQFRQYTDYQKLNHELLVVLRSEYNLE